MNKFIFSNKILYILIVLIILLSILFLWFIESSNNKQFISEQRSHIQQQLNTIRNRLENHTLNNIHLLKGLPSVIGLMPNLTEQQFANITQPLISGYGSIRNIGLAPNMIIKMVYPLKGNEKAIGLDYRTQELEYALIELARKKQVVILSGPIKLVQGGIGIIGRIPVFIKNNQGQEVFWGIISSVIDSHILYRNSGLLDADLNIHIALRGKNGQGASGDVFFGDEAIFYNHPIILNIPLPYGYWQIAAVPKKGWKTQADNVWMIRFGFISLMFLILIIFFILLRNKEMISLSHKKYQRLVDDVGENFAIYSHSGHDEKITYVSSSAEKIFGRSIKEVIGEPFSKVVQWNQTDLQLAKFYIQQRIKGFLDFIQFELRFIHPKKGERVVQVSSHSVRNEQGDLIAIDGIIEDITERKYTHEQMKLASAVFEHSQEGIMISDKNNCIIDINPAGLTITGYTRQEIIGQTPKLFSAGKTTPKFYKEMWQSLNTVKQWQGEIWNSKKSGEMYFERISINTITDEKGNIKNYIAVFYDITYIKAHQAELERIAYNDILTELPNRLLLQDRLQQAISKTCKNNTLLAVCYFDLDGFKKVNDTYGHKTGDNILIEVAQRLLANVREEDTVARIGGDEFVLLLLNLESIGELQKILDCILVSIATPYFITQKKIDYISGSMGLALYPNDADEADTLLRHADQAMYLSKKKGKNCYSFFDVNEDLKIISEHHIQKELQQALKRDELRLFYQPKVNMHTGEVIGVEALIRWLHPEKGLLTPNSFIPSIEHSPLMVEVGHWLLRQALIQIQAWQMLGIQLKVSVNIDAIQLQQIDFIDSLKLLLDEFNDVSASQLELEILENSALHDIDSVSRIIKECTELGIQFSLDDFGTGYSSLTYLKRLSAHTLKIDQSFISNLLENSDDMAIVEGIIGLSHAFHCTVIAEGVESIEVGTLLLNLGCQFAQGYIISRPMPAEALPQWLVGFCIPKQWREANSILNSEFGYNITLLYLSHHQWSIRVQQAIKQRASSLIPEHFCDASLCKIGLWIKGDGQQYYSQFPEFNLMIDKHKQCHSLISEVIKQIDNHQYEALQLTSIKLNHLSSAVLNYLNRLRNISFNELQ